MEFYVQEVKSKERGGRNKTSSKRIHQTIVEMAWLHLTSYLTNYVPIMFLISSKKM